MNIPSVLSLKTTLITAAVALLIGMGAGGKIGWDVRDADYQAHLVQDGKDLIAWNKKVNDLEGEAQDITDELNSQLIINQALVRQTTSALIQKVPYYVTAKSDAACPIPVGLVELHNQATGSASQVPVPSGGDRDSPSTVTLSQLTEVNIHNIGVAKELEAEVLTWRSWYQQQAKAWNAIADPSSNERDTRSGGTSFTPITIYDKAPAPGPLDGIPSTEKP